MTSRFILFAVAIFLAGCQALTPLASVGPGAKTWVGQLRYDTGTRTVVGDVILSGLPNGDFDLEFSKGGLPVLQIQTRGNQMRATGLLARGGWSGSAQHPPGPLKPWAELRQIGPHFNNPNETKAENIGIWAADFRRKGAALSGVEIRFSTGESMIFSFAQ
jgi:hypothetical protein